MEIQIEPTITKDYLLSKYPQETYMEYYLGIPVKKGYSNHHFELMTTRLVHFM